MDDEAVYDDDDGIIEIPLGEDMVAWIDEIDRPLAANTWSLKQAGKKDMKTYYAYRQWRVNTVRGEYYLHNEVWERMMGTALPEGFLVDHINKDKLDCRRSNLRLATRMDNEANKRKRRTQAGGSPSSQYKGVSKVKDGRKKCWRGTLTHEKRQIHLGSYFTEREAAEAYNVAAREYFGEFAHLNEFE